jgi:hypothetical protein
MIGVVTTVSLTCAYSRFAVVLATTVPWMLGKDIITSATPHATIQTSETTAQITEPEPDTPYPARLPARRLRFIMAKTGGGAPAGTPPPTPDDDDAAIERQRSETRTREELVSGIQLQSPRFPRCTSHVCLDISVFISTMNKTDFHRVNTFNTAVGSKVRHGTRQ